MAAVVVHYRAAEPAMRCIASIRALEGPAPRILVVDNDSGDESVARLRSGLAEVEILEAGCNLGYGAGANLGVREALRGGAEFVWVLTPDVVLDREALLPLLQTMTGDARVGICGSIVHAGDLCIVRSELRERWGYLPKHVTAPQESIDATAPAHASDYVDGCALLLRAEMVRRIGLLRDDWFLYFEETEYCLRARECGWAVRISPRSHVFTRPITEQRHDRGFYMIRNSVLLARTRRRYRGRTVARHLLTPVLYLARLRLHPEYRNPATVLKAVGEGLRKPLAPVPSV